MYPSLAVATAYGASVPAASIGTAPIGSSGGNALTQTTVGVMSENRPLFAGLQSWISQGIGTSGCLPEGAGAASRKEGPGPSGAKEAVQSQALKNIVPYTRGEDCCFLCKEKLRVERDRTIQALAGSSLAQDGAALGLNGCPSSDENSYFIDAKRIRVSLRNAATGVLEKREVTVHLECFKQLEQRKAQKA